MMGRLLFLTIIMYGVMLFGDSAAAAVAGVHDGTLEAQEQAAEVGEILATME